MDKTSIRLFFQLVKMARRFSYFDPTARHNILMGMWLAIRENREDFTIADNQRDVWKNQNAQAEPFEG